MTTNTEKYILNLLLWLTLFCVPVLSDYVVQTSSGPVRGQTIRRHTNEEVETFLGIPFAESPTGKLRFKPPVPIKSWKSIFNATTHPGTCYQRKVPFGNYFPQLKPWNPFTKFTEDCLKLNIWVPVIKKETNRTELLPVMIFIHGGGFSRGSVSVPLYDGHVLASEQQVLVAMMNYRVASLGFLFLNHTEVPGNAGLYDQLLALHWLKKNARAFGGNPDKITLFGQSAGAASVGHHVLSPLSRGLFHRAILESGSPTASWAFASKKDALELSNKQVEDLGCKNEILTETFRCLQKKDPEDLISVEPVKGVDYVYAHKPISESEFLPGNPSDMLQNENFNPVDLIIGVNKDEGTFFLMTYDPLTFPLHQQFNADFLTWRSVQDAMTYNGWEPLTQQIVGLLYDEKRHELLDFLKSSFEDFLIDCPTKQVDESFAAMEQKVFRYLFAHRTAKSVWPKWTGVMHVDELQYIFGVPLRNDSTIGTTFSDDEVQLSKNMMSYWGNFARTGNPNGNDDDATYWPRYTLETKKFVVFAANSTKIERGFKEKVCSFWSDLRPQLLSKRTNFSDEFDNKIAKKSSQNIFDFKL